MLKVHNLEKYYNRNKKNEIHVLNDISLTFPQKGLVVLLGESGSGKTTLLNVLGGMDNFRDGTITINDQAIHKYSSRVFDEQRMKHIGMIFQNYYLLKDQTVYENIALTLRMIGLTDLEEIEKRIIYLLEAVHMEKYKNRLASQLSGGEQQRVAIARALAKNPSVVLADEPTGNLDSKNSIDIMQIIKQISKEKLVVLVTHERHLANYFADRIIEIEDGQIKSDKENTQTGELDARTSSDIYLGSLTHDSPKSDHANIDVYKDLDAPVTVQLIIKNNTLYLDISDKNIKNIVSLKDRPDITVHKGKEEDLTPLEESTSFNYQSIIRETPYTKPKNPVNIKHVIYHTLAKLWQAGKGQKLLYIGFLIGAMVFAQAISNTFNIITVEDSDFVEFPKQTIEVTGEFTYDDLTALKTNDAISNVYYLPIESVIRLSTPPVYVGGYYQDNISIYSRTIPLTEIQSRDLSHGRMPNNPYEVVVDQAWIKDHIFNQDPYHALGFDTYKDLLRFTIPISTSSGDFVFEIVGISDTAAPVIYTNEAFGIMNELKDQAHPYSLLENEINIVAGRTIQNDNEILMPRMPSQNPNDFTPRSHNLLGEDVTIVGLYEFIDDDLTNSSVIAPDALLKEFIFNRSGGDNTERYIFASDIDQALNTVNQNDMEGRYLYQELRDEFYTTQVRNAMPSLIFSGIVILASAISFFFVIRSSMISRIYEIGVFRSLGTKKTHILKRFAIETAVLTTFSSFIGFSIMTYILYSAQNAIGDAFTIAHVSFLSVLTGIALLYTINILSGLLPVFILLRKTPAQINTQYDL